VEKPSLLAMCALEIYPLVVRLFSREPNLIPIVEHTLILREGRVKQYETFFLLFQTFINHREEMTYEI
jgi:hypothetical protein